MDTELERVSEELPQTTVPDRINGILGVEHSDMLTSCALCQRVLSYSEAGDLESLNICGDCNFLFLEELESPIQDGHARRTPRFRRARYSSSESTENLFSQQFSSIINVARQIHPTVSELENHSVDSDTAARSLQHTSSRTTPTGSGRWRRLLSDTESEGFNSLYEGNESDVSFSAYRLFYGESDNISFSAFGGDSDASMDGHNFMDNELFTRASEGSDLDSDTDIDPMHAGPNHWNSDDLDEEEEEGNEWEEADSERNIISSFEAVDQLPQLLSSNESTVSANRRSLLHSSEFDGAIDLRVRERIQTYIPNIFANLEETIVQPYARNSDNYHDARGFEELLEHLADSSRRGAPPAALSFVNNLPCLVINEQQEKQDGLACAICKDSLSVGTVVNQLPCFHVYHPSCILPWLSARSSCPLCRYELPTDDKNSEDRKRSSIPGLVFRETQLQDMNNDSFSYSSDGDEADEACEFNLERTEHGVLANVDNNTESFVGNNARRRWFFLAAAAPIVSLVGIVLVMWLGSPLTDRREPIYREIHVQRPDPNCSSPPGTPDQREFRNRRWWSF